MTKSNQAMRRVEGPRIQWIDDTGRHRYKWKQLDGSIGGREGGFMYPSVTETLGKIS